MQYITPGNPPAGLPTLPRLYDLWRAGSGARLDPHLKSSVRSFNVRWKAASTFLIPQTASDGSSEEIVGRALRFRPP
jgi:hypothetical protein